MSWFRRRITNAEIEVAAEQSSIEVTAIKRKTKQTTQQTAKDIDRLNKLLKANGITLKIHIAAGGHHGQ